MRIAMVTRDFAPYATTREARAPADLAAALGTLGHEVHAVALLPEGIDTEPCGLARRLRPLVAAGPDGETSWHRFDGLSPSGVRAHLLAPIPAGNGQAPEPDFPRAAVELALSLGPGTTWCCSFGPECAATAAAGAAVPVLDDRVLRHLLVLAGPGEPSADFPASIEAHEHVVILGSAVADGWRSRSPVLGRLAREGRLFAFPAPVSRAARLSAADRAGRKAAFQVRHGLPVRADVPLVVLDRGAAAVPGLLKRLLRQDVQAVAPDGEGASPALTERYPDRLVAAGPGLSVDGCLSAADIAVIAGDPAGAPRAMARGAVPVVAPTDAEGVVDLAPDLSSGSGLVAGGGSADDLLEAFGRAAGAFRSGPAFSALTGRIQDYPPPWSTLAARFAGLMADPVSEPTDPTPDRPSTTA